MKLKLELLPHTLCRLVFLIVSFSSHIAIAEQVDKHQMAGYPYNYNAACLFSDIVMRMYAPNLDSFKAHSKLSKVEKSSDGGFAEYYSYKHNNISAELTFTALPERKLMVEKLRIVTPSFFRNAHMNRPYFFAVFQVNSSGNSISSSGEIKLDCDNANIEIGFDEMSEPSYISVHINSDVE